MPQENKVNLYNENKSKTEFFVFHIQRKALNFFCRSINNKSFMLYLLCLELSNKKGFCRLNTKDLAQTFRVTPKSICNWLKDIHNNNHITAYYNPYKHYWKVRINTKRHYELWKQFDGEEMPNTQFSDDDINSILRVLDGKPKENNAVSNKKAPNVTNNVNNANATDKIEKNNNADNSTKQGILGLVSNIIENPHFVDDIIDKRLSHNDNSNVKNESLAESPRNDLSKLNISNDNTHNENAENGTIKNESTNLSQSNEPQSQESQNNSNKSNESESNENKLNDSDSEPNSNKNLNESQNGGNKMSEDELEDLELEETSKKIKAFMEKFNFGVNQTRSERDKNQKVLIVTPYKTFISDNNDKNDTDNVKYMLEMIEQLDKMGREHIISYVGQPISPIKKALRNAKARIRAKKVTAQNEINKIMQTTLNKIDFLKEVESVDSVSIWCLNYNNLRELESIEQKARLLNKQTNIYLLSYLNNNEEAIRINQQQNGIDDPFFHITPPQTSDVFDDFNISEPAQPKLEQSAESENSKFFETPTKAEVS